MTNTESRIAIELEELALGDDARTHEDAEQQITEADIHELELYGFDSDKQTLVGLGPVERARLARLAAEVPDSQRAPQSESPGPFIADDDAEIVRSLRGRKLGPWAVAAPALLIVAIVAVLALRGLAPSAPHASAVSLPVVAVAPPPQNVPPPPPEVVQSPDPVPSPQDVPQPSAVVVESPVAPAEAPARLGPKVETASVSGPMPSSERARLVAPVVPAALPVKLTEVPPPTVDDMSSTADANVGAIDVTSNPPANVVLDGRPLGKAPRVVKVPAGLHTLVFIHPLYGRQSRSVNVGPGQTSSASVDF